MTPTVEDMLAARDAIKANGATLTPRQDGVLRLYLAGVSVRGIARELGLSRATVREHLAAALAKARKACM